MIGQFGQVSALFSCSRRLRQNFEIGHRQRALADRGADAVGAGVAAADDDDVLAGSEDGLVGGRRFAGHTAVLLRQELHGEMDALELAAGHRQVVRLFGAAGEHDGVMLGDELVDRKVDADIGAVMEDDAFGLHLHDAAVDVDLLHLEVGNAVAHQPAGLGVFLEHMYSSGRRGRAAARRRARQGLSRRRRPSCRSSPPAGSGLRPCAMARSAIAHSIDLMVTGFSSMLSVQDASHGAGQTRPVTSGKLLVECRLRAASSQLPRIDEVVPVRDLVVDRAARRAGGERAGALAIGHAAIHAARRLGAIVVLLQRQDEFVPMADALGDRLVVTVVAFVVEKTGDLAHCAPLPNPTLPPAWPPPVP